MSGRRQQYANRGHPTVRDEHPNHQLGSKGDDGLAGGIEAGAPAVAPALPWPHASACPVSRVPNPPTMSASAGGPCQDNVSPGESRVAGRVAKGQRAGSHVIRYARPNQQGSSGIDAEQEYTTVCSQGPQGSTGSAREKTDTPTTSWDPGWVCRLSGGGGALVWRANT